MPAAAVDGAPLRHIVLFRFHPHTTAAEVAQVEAAFADLAHTIAEVRSFAWGTNSSPEGLDQGYTHAYTLHFAHAAARDAYLVHPLHQAFGALVTPHLAGVLVLDHIDRFPNAPAA
jgi:hypothetical protein